MLLHPCARLLETTKVGDATLARFTDPNLGTANAEVLGACLLAIADAPGCRELHLDLDRVDFLGSTALGKVVAVHKRMHARGGRLTLHNVRPEVYGVFEVTLLTTVLDVRRKEEAGAA